MGDEMDMVKIPQLEAAYMPLTASKGQACANCRWLCVGEETHCHLVESYPDNILPTGWCNRWEEKPEAELEPEPIPVMIVGGEVEAEVEYESLVERNLKALPKLFKQLFNRDKSLPEFAVFKGIDGKPYWVARYTNNFEDRESEIISAKALVEDVARKNAGFVPMPELWSWHTPGSRHGVATLLANVGHFNVAVGTFDDTPEAQNAIKFYRRNAGKVELSHGFTHPQWAFKDGIYEVINTFEISTLPPGAAANPFTSFEEIATMAFSETQRAWLKATLGDDAAARIETETEAQSKALEELGVRYKDFVELSEDKVEKSADTVTMGEAFLDVLKTQGELMTIQQAFANRQDKFEEAVKASNDLLVQAKALLEQIQVERAAAPRIASEADETALPDNMTDKLKEKLPEGLEFDPFFGDLKIRKGSA